MPTPVGHTLAGLLIQFAGCGTALRRHWRRLLMLVVLANAPDIDFLFGYLAGNAGAYHWGPTHSLAAAVLVGGGVGALAAIRSGRYMWMIAMTTAAYASHILLDMLIGHGGLTPTFGLQVFWPFSTEHFMLPWALFKMAPAPIATNPVAVLLSNEVVPVIERELLILVPLVTATWAIARIQDHSKRFVDHCSGADFRGSAE